MPHFEQTLSSETLFEGRVIRVTLDKVRLENGRTSTREVVHHHGGAGIAALDENGNIYLVRQYRYAPDQELIEIPAGKLEPAQPWVYHSHLRLLQRGYLPLCRHRAILCGPASG